MPADYDLVVLGGTVEGRDAALCATGYGARVALIEPPDLFHNRQQAKYLLKGLEQIAAGQAQQHVQQWFYSEERSSQSVELLDWAALVEWSAIAAKTQQPEYSLLSLSASGVDVIYAMPERLSQGLIVTAGGRHLKTRSVLAAFGTVPLPTVEPHAFSGSAITGVESLLNRKVLPEQVFVWGDGLVAIAWAEALSTLGVQVTLVAVRLLREEDADIRGWVRSHLIATGIRLATLSELVGNGLSAAEKQTLANQSLFLSATQLALTLPEFVYHRANQYPDADEQQDMRKYLLSNQYLQTAHARVFACGSCLHSQAISDRTARYEAQVATWNALFIKNKKIDDSSTPQSYNRIARAGKTPRFAIEGRSPTDGYTIWSASSANSADLRRVSPSPSYCKLICKHNRLQSIHLFGDGASELIEALALTLGKPIRYMSGKAKGLPMQASADCLTDLVRTAASQAIQSQWQPGQWRRDWAENWFNWRRSR
ncbi:MAG: FAD-dependent oxidoreductase [Cyanobacteria bacterium J06581_3]